MDILWTYQQQQATFKGTSFGSMSGVLNAWLGEAKASTRPCDRWSVEELQKPVESPGGYQRLPFLLSCFCSLLYSLLSSMSTGTMTNLIGAIDS